MTADLGEVQRRAVTNWIDGMARADLELAYSGFDEGATWLGIDSQFRRVMYPDKQATIEYLSAWIGGVWKDGLHYRPVSLLSDENTTVLEWEDEVPGGADTGGVGYTNRGVLVFEFDGMETVQRARSYFDYEPLLGTRVANFDAARRSAPDVTD